MTNPEGPGQYVPGNPGRRKEGENMTNPEGPGQYVPGNPGRRKDTEKEQIEASKEVARKGRLAEVANRDPKLLEELLEVRREMEYFLTVVALGMDSRDAFQTMLELRGLARELTHRFMPQGEQEYVKHDQVIAKIQKLRQQLGIQGSVEISPENIS